MRVRAIDWLRGLVIVLMTVDHAGGFVDSSHMHADNGLTWIPGSALPAGEFLTRWVTHLCAPTFVLLAGASLALSDEKRRGQPGQTRFIVTRGLVIAALDPIWMSLGFAGYAHVIFQVLYAIGMAMVCMAGLRRLPSSILFALAVLIQLAGELTARWQPTCEPLRVVWVFLFVGGRAFGNVVCFYPLVPWLSFMMFGWVLGRWLVDPARSPRARARALALVGVALLALFVVVRGLDGYGNWGLHRDSLDVLQWLHVNKYPPALAFTALELGLAFLLFAGFVAIDDSDSPRRALAPLSLFGSTALFYYLLHVHLLHLAQRLLEVDQDAHGVAATWLSAALVLAVLAGPCWWYRRYKRTHGDGWARYI